LFADSKYHGGKDIGRKIVDVNMDLTKTKGKN